MPVADDILEKVRTEARRRGVRWTTQRTAIVETLMRSGEHITVDELHRRVRALDATVSPATVYRTVNMLVEIGMVQKRHFAAGSASFEWSLNKDHHDHLVCVHCGAIEEFQHDLIESLQEQVATEYGFLLTTHRMELYGICKACRANGVTAQPGNHAAAH